MQARRARGRGRGLGRGRRRALGLGRGRVLPGPDRHDGGRAAAGRSEGELEPRPPMDTPRWFLSSTQLGSAVLTWTHLRWADLHGTGLLGSGQLG